MKTLTVYLRGGLANRIKPLASCARIAANMGRQLRVCWQPYIDWIPRKDSPSQRIIFPNVWEVVMKEPVPFTDVPPIGFENNKNIVDADDEREDIPIATWKWCHFSNEPDVDLVFNLKDEQQELLLRELRPWVEKYCEPLKVYSRIRFDIGIHYRRFHYNIQNFSITCFQLLEALSWQKIFFTTDCKSTHEWVRDHYSTVQTWYKTHDILTDVIHGHTLNDLYSLAHSNKIYGSKHSTFAEVAWVWGGFMPFQILEDYVHG